MLRRAVCTCSATSEYTPNAGNDARDVSKCFSMTAAISGAGSSGCSTGMNSTPLVMFDQKPAPPCSVITYRIGSVMLLPSSGARSSRQVKKDCPSRIQMMRICCPGFVL